MNNRRAKNVALPREQSPRYIVFDKLKRLHKSLVTFEKELQCRRETHRRTLLALIDTCDHNPYERVACSSSNFSEQTECEEETDAEDEIDDISMEDFMEGRFPSIACPDKMLQIDLRSNRVTMGYIGHDSGPSSVDFDVKYDILLPIHRKSNAIPIFQMVMLNPGESMQLDSLHFFIEPLCPSVDIFVEGEEDPSQNPPTWKRLRMSTWYEISHSQRLCVNHTIYVILPPSVAMPPIETSVEKQDHQLQRKYYMQTFTHLDTCGNSPPSTQNISSLSDVPPQTPVTDGHHTSHEEEKQNADSNLPTQQKSPHFIQDSHDPTPLSGLPNSQGSLPDTVTVHPQRRPSTALDDAPSLDFSSPESHIILTRKRPKDSSVRKTQNSKRHNADSSPSKRKSTDVVASLSVLSMCIATSGFVLLKSIEKKVEALHISVQPLFVSNKSLESRCSALVVPVSPRRTVKLLCAISLGLDIVSVKWLENCARKKKLENDLQRFRICNAQIEKRYSFVLSESLDRSRRMLSSGCRLFSAKKIYVAKHLLSQSSPHDSDVSLVLRSAGASIEDTIFVATESTTFCIIASPESLHEVSAQLQHAIARSGGAYVQTSPDVSEHNTRAALRRRRMPLANRLPPIVSTEWLYCSVLRQELLDFAPYRLKVNGVK